MELFELSAKIGIDDKELDKGIDRAENKVIRFGNGFSKMAGVASMAISGIGGAMVAMGVQSNASLETSTVAWTTLLGSQEKANKMLKDITEYAKTTPFSKVGVDEMAKQLNNAGYKGQALFDQLTKFGNLGSAFGVQEDSLKEMVRQYGQVQQAQVAYTEDLNILQDRGIPIYTALAEVTGKTVAQVKKMAGEGKITADIYNKAVDSIASKTGGAMEAQSKTFTGLWSTIQDGTENIVQKLMIPVFEYLKGVLESSGPIIETLGGAIDNMMNAFAKGEGLGEALRLLFEPFVSQDVLGIITGVATAIQDMFTWIIENSELVTALITGIATAMLAWNVIAILQGLITAFTAWRTATEAMTLAQALLNVVLNANPVGVIVVAIGAFVSALVYAYQTSETFRNIVSSAFQGIMTYIDLWKSMFEIAFSVVSAVFSVFTGDIDAGIQGIEDAFSGLVSKFEAIGGDMVRGMWEGLRSGWDWLVSGFKSLVDGLPEVAKAALGIHSPSRVFMEIGGYTAEGMGVGFENEMKNVNKQFQGAISSTIDVSNKSAKGINSVGGNGSGGSQGIVINQTINSKAQLSPFEIAKETLDLKKRLDWRLA